MSEERQSVIGHTRFLALDGMRGIAAISVMIHHFTFQSASLLYNAGLAVDLFFMLSGFVIAHSYGRRLRQGMSVSEYLGARLIRLYPMFVMGILIGAPVLYLLQKAGLANSSMRFIAGSLFYNLLFVPDVNGFWICNFGGTYLSVGELFPANPPAWSLFFEMVASVAFVFLFKAEIGTLIRVIAFCYVVLLLDGMVHAFVDYQYAFDLDAGWASSSLFGGFPRVLFGFSVGLLLCSLAGDDKFSRLRAFIERRMKHPYLLYLLLISVFAFPNKLAGIYPAVILAVAAPGLVFAGSMVSFEGVATRNLAKFLGWVSYPIYCLHFPIGRAVFLFADSAHYSKTFAIFASIAITFVVSIILTKLCEEPVRAYLSRKFLQGSSSAIGGTGTALERGAKI
jgi:peptidoglycan/LPS O-acetylase OafA/YrhL